MNRHLAELDSLQFVITKQMLAYFDIFSCVPCVRRPILDKRYWLADEACVSEENIEGSGLDPVVGCFSAVVALIGRSSALVCAVFEDEIEMRQYLIARDELLKLLASWKLLDRPRHAHPGVHPFKPTPVNGSGVHNLFLAGNAHSLATQIFLHRTTNFDQIQSKFKY